MEDKLLDIESQIDVLFGNDASNEERQQADAWIRQWQYSEEVFDQCFAIITRELSSSNLNSRLLFISIKTLQEHIRYNFDNLEPDLIDSISECITEIIKAYVCQWESENSDQEEDIAISPQLQFSLVTICDMITMTNSNFHEVEETFPDCLKMHFYSLFFEEVNESYYYDHISKCDLIQKSLIEYGIEMLADAPMSTEWVRCFGAIVSMVETYEMIVPLISRLPETISNIDSISHLQTILTNIYSGTFFQYKPFFEIILEFHITYSQELRELADSEPLIHPILQFLWSSFFRIDYCELYSNIELLIAAFQEFFEVTSILEVDIPMWAKLLDDAFKMFYECKKSKNKELLCEMEPINLIFFQLCSHLFMKLIELFCHYKNMPTDEINDEIALTDFNPNSYDDTICNLHSLSKEQLNHFLIEEEPKTIGLLKIAGMNAQYLDEELFCQYSEFALSFEGEDVDEEEILVVCQFINSAFKYADNYIIPFILYEIEAYPIIPKFSSDSLRNISQFYPECFLQADSEILTTMINLLKMKCGQNPSKANLIIITLNIISKLEPFTIDNIVLNQIISFCVQFAMVATQDMNYLEPFVKFIRCIINNSKVPSLTFFYNRLADSLIESLETILNSTNNDVQYFVSLLFKSLIIHNWLSDLTIASEYIQQAIDNGITQLFHFNNIVFFLPLELIPVDAIELCNNAFNPLTSTTTNLNLSVEMADYKVGQKGVDDIIKVIQKLIYVIVDGQNFDLLELINPQIFTEIILKTNTPNILDFVYRTILKTIEISEVGEVPHDILICILRGCTLKAFRCQKHEEVFLLTPMVMLSHLIPQDEYCQIFFDAIPEIAHENESENEEDNPAINYLNVIYNPLSQPIECSIAMSNFIKYMNMAFDQSVQ